MSGVLLHHGIARGSSETHQDLLRFRAARAGSPQQGEFEPRGFLSRARPFYTQLGKVMLDALPIRRAQLSREPRPGLEISHGSDGSSGQGQRLIDWRRRRIRH